MSETTDPVTPETPTTFSADYVKDLRDEAARYRTEKKDAVDTAKTETRSEVVKEYEPQLAEKDGEIATLKADLGTATVDNLKLRAVLGAEGVSAGDVLELVELVQGTDEETISESVKRVLKVYSKNQNPVVPNSDPSQGSGGGTIPLNGDPVVRMFEQALGIKTSR